MSRTTLDWLVVVDPSDTFTQGLFHLRAIETSAQQYVWPEGIVFRNRVTGEQRCYAHGQLLVTSEAQRQASAEV